MRRMLIRQHMKLLGLTALLALLCLSAGAAHAAAPGQPAASFNCGVAPGPDEQVICADIRLRQADRDLSLAYRAALAASSVPTHVASVKADEHRWITERNNECQITKYTLVNDENRPKFVDCFLDEYAERLADLEQIKLNPAIDPTTISHPIRKSFLDHASAPVSPPRDLVFATINAATGSSQPPLMAWRRDGALLILAVRSGGEGVLSSWRPDGQKVLAHIPHAARFGRICPSGEGTVLVAGDETLLVDAHGAAHASERSKLPADIRRLCGLDGNGRQVTNGKDTVLVIEGATSPAMPSLHYVSLAGPSGSRPVTPPIRLDSRFRLRAAYLAFDDKFLVSAASRPAGTQGAVERRWSKTNCQPYWLVSPATAEASAACIPFGPYVGAVPQPLPTRAGVFFSAESDGLYRIAGGVAQPVLNGTVERPIVSPDGCSIAFTQPPGTGVVAGPAGTIIVLAACDATKAAN